MKFPITVVQDEDGVYVTECPLVPGCVSQGSTEEDAIANVGEAIKECLEFRAEKGMPPTIPIREVEVAV